MLKAISLYCHIDPQIEVLFQPSKKLLGEIKYERNLTYWSFYWEILLRHEHNKIRIFQFIFGQ